MQYYIPIISDFSKCHYFVYIFLFPTIPVFYFLFLQFSLLLFHLVLPVNNLHVQWRQLTWLPACPIWSDTLPIFIQLCTYWYVGFYCGWFSEYFPRLAELLIDSIIIQCLWLLWLSSSSVFCYAWSASLVLFHTRPWRSAHGSNSVIVKNFRYEETSMKIFFSLYRFHKSSRDSRQLGSLGCRVE